ncbi:ABC transporter ATP-binding protein [Marinobacterium sediminicola]|uniref:Hydroxymethylpyrimidine transport system ATP-binding protein n=1 Tax=Marinobacterium sediminicola TaxID=518898 RepID=A0ABY1S450_9GAMM|nr:ABC transporter ATP-binding protein [Marinobacterium sediminicola]ULG69201.1 ABC transporter ATP-binding protein [Marinobacterium sediminicola]SMR78282.1 putative hydroxymethylpyrimidine transport system ATP-binding protein [Marinobacterium sediminicola]
MDIRLEQASLHWQHHCVFSELNLELPEGQWTSILGQSGVGKSSLLQLLCGIADDADIKGRILCSDGLPLQGRVAWMAQQDLLLPWLSVLDNVLLAARLQGNRLSPGEVERARYLLSQVQLADRAEARPDQLSGGQRQRVALARTLFQDQPLVCMDEPFSALDAITRLKLQDLAVQLLADRTVLMITHDPLEALRLSDRILVLQGHPARLSEAIEPSGSVPRAIDAPEVLHHQARLLKQLAQETI